MKSKIENTIRDCLLTIVQTVIVIKSDYLRSIFHTHLLSWSNFVSCSSTITNFQNKVVNVSSLLTEQKFYCKKQKFVVENMPLILNIYHFHCLYSSLECLILLTLNNSSQPLVDDATKPLI